MGGSRKGSGVRWYSGRGGRLEESITLVAIWSFERSKAVSLISERHGCWAFAPWYYKNSSEELSEEVVRIIKRFIVIIWTTSAVCRA